MNTVLQFVLFTALVATVFGAIDTVYNVTSSLQDYTFLVGRHMQNELDIGAMQIATVNARHQDRIDAIINQQQLVLQEVQQFDNILVQQQAFSLNRKHCVQKYKPRLANYNEVDRNFTQCIYNAEFSAMSLTAKAENNLQGAKNIRDDMQWIFPSCNTSYSHIQSLLENCVSVKVEQQVNLFNDHMEQVQLRSLESLYESSVIATTANRCSFTVEKSVLTVNGAVSGSTEICVDDFKNNGLTLGIENRNVIKTAFMQTLMGSKYLN